MSTNVEAPLTVSVDSPVHEDSTTTTTTTSISSSSSSPVQASVQSHTPSLSTSPSYYQSAPLESSRPQHIPRPPNAFILFRSDVIRRYKEKQKASGIAEERKQQTFSKVAGECWRQLSDEERQVWIDLAEERKLAHQERFPEYRFTPRRCARPIMPEEDAKLQTDSQESVQRICSILNISDRPGITSRRKETQATRSQRGVGHQDFRHLRTIPSSYLLHGDSGLPPYFPPARMSPVDTYHPFGAPEFGAPMMPYGYAPFPYPSQHYAPFQTNAWGPMYGAPFYPPIMDTSAYTRALERPTTVSPPGPGYITTVPSPTGTESVSPTSEQGSHPFDLDYPPVEPATVSSGHSPVDSKVGSWQEEQVEPQPISPVSMISNHDSAGDYNSYYNTRLDEEPAFVDNISTEWPADWMLGASVSVAPSPEQEELYYTPSYLPSP